jgi:hypothetical protein
MSKSVSEKMGIREGGRAILIGDTDGAQGALKLPTLRISARLSGEFDYIHFFAKTQVQLNRKFPVMRKHLRQGGMLWISWPKAGQLESDLDIKNVIKIGYDHGLVESKTLSVNETWSAIKFTWPRKGIEYKNSYGKLKTT